MRHPLPYAFARSHQLLLEDDGQQLTLWHAAPPNAPGAPALSEVLRKHPSVRHLQALDAPALAQRISAAYAQGESSAATGRPRPPGAGPSPPPPLMRGPIPAPPPWSAKSKKVPTCRA